MSISLQPQNLFEKKSPLCPLSKPPHVTTPLALQTSVVPACAFVGIKTAESVGGMLTMFLGRLKPYTSPVVIKEIIRRHMLCHLL